MLDTPAAADDATPRGNLARDVDASQPSVEFVTAPIPDAVWPGLLADPSAIAHVIVSKYDDLLPLHRQEGISRREGFTVSRSTQCGWFGPAHAVLGRIVDAMFDDGKANAFCMATDATSARVRESMAPCTPWHVFVFVADQDHVVFRHSRTHDSVVLAEMLKGYQGYLLGDATSIYSPLADMIVLACCWAHVRRYFFKARESDPTRAVEAISIIGKLFDIERACSDLKGDAKTSRRATARPRDRPRRRVAAIGGARRGAFHTFFRLRRPRVQRR
ncbi:MAG: transposase [Polyangiaceae bacterium]|nr:transposase [Polyangiaceae bacterium]